MVRTELSSKRGTDPAAGLPSVWAVYEAYRGRGRPTTPSRVPDPAPSEIGGLGK